MSAEHCSSCLKPVWLCQCASAPLKSAAAEADGNEAHRKGWEAAEARVAELEKALEPFAELAGGFDAHIYNDEKLPLLFKDDDHPVDERGPTIGDLRRARAALSPTEPDGRGG